MEPKIKYNPQAKTLTEAVGVDELEVFTLWTEAMRDAKTGGELVALIWERAPTPQHALVAAIFAGCWFMDRYKEESKEGSRDGRDSGQGTPDA